uniref:Cap-specific mRNA (nucleoside-2'-O-)-methyltransferase 1 n=1 Tax=Panagrolaimus sp. JU765 TaxID=591449 RepID=A0AC34QA20_9BILA
MSHNNFSNLRRARDEDRQEGLQEEMSSMTTDQSDSSGSDSEEDFRPSFGGYNPNPGYNAKTRKRQLSSDADSSAVKKKKDEDAAAGQSDFAMRYMQKFGYQEGTGLGRHQTGIVEPIKATGNVKRHGLGDEKAKAFQIEVGAVWDDSLEDKQVEEYPDFLECPGYLREDTEIKPFWIKVGSPKLVIDDEDEFCDREIIAAMLESKNVFDHLTDRELHNARIRANPFETIKSAIFQNRAAMKMANLDKIFNWQLTLEGDDRCRQEKCPVTLGNTPSNNLSRRGNVFYFADVCAGPGGFSEYVIWRKAYYNSHGFGFTLRGENDFKLDKFLAGSSCYFDPYYGPKDDGNIYDPENLEALEKYVRERTGGQGVHLVMADGGFSVEGQENIQEILSKRLYLCQFIAALSLCRVHDSSDSGGNFICKLFDIFTPFSVGLIYLMYLSFAKVSLHKPITSRPANSERYLYCQDLTPFGLEVVKPHLIEINKKLESFKLQGKEKEFDVMEVVPMDVIRDDDEFCAYIKKHNELLARKQTLYLQKYHVFAKDSGKRDKEQGAIHDDEFCAYIKKHNELLARKQTLYLQKYHVFAKDSGKRDKEQGAIRDRALEYWEIPNIDRKALMADANKPTVLLFRNLAKDLQGREMKRPRKLSLSEFMPGFPKQIFHEEYNVQFLCSTQDPFILMSDYKENAYTRTLSDVGFTKMEDYPKFPKQTLFFAEKVQRIMNGHKDRDVIRILDAAIIDGDNVSRLPLTQRLDAARKFVQAFTVRGQQPHLVVASATSIMPSLMEDFVKSLFPPSTGSVPFMRDDEQPHFYYPVRGIRFPRCYKSNISKCFSTSSKQKYYHDSTHNMSREAKEGPNLMANFWDNLAEGVLQASWILNSHSKTTPVDILEKDSAPDVLTLPAIMNHISKLAEDWCNCTGVSRHYVFKSQ